MTTVVLLAAGRSRRFGPACKLQAIYRGKPLIRHAAEAVLGSGLPAIAVVADPAVAALLPEFRTIFSSGVQSDSLRAGLQHVTDGDALIVLGDMPHVPADLLRNIAASTAPAAATDGTRICPPVLLPESLFAAVETLRGDRGAGDLLRTLPDLHLVRTASDILKDVDFPQDLLWPYALPSPPKI